MVAAFALPSEASQTPEAITRYAPPPYIPTASPHYAYALLIVNGWEHADACEHLDLNPRTVERWKTELKRIGCRHFGRNVSYEFCARHATNSKRTSDELRKLYETAK